jgi:hypothetical protein
MCYENRVLLVVGSIYLSSQSDKVVPVLSVTYRYSKARRRCFRDIEIVESESQITMVNS